MSEANAINFLAGIKAILEDKNWLIASAESLTSGNVQALLGSMTGSSNFFAGGVCAYNIDQKEALLGVDYDYAASCNCVSAQVAEQMAEGVRRLMGVDVGVATTGYIEENIEAEKFGPHAYLAISIKGKGTASCHVKLSDYDARSRPERQRKLAERVIRYVYSELREA